MAGPWEKYAQPPAQGGVTVGQRDPYKVAAEQRAQEDQSFQREKFAFEKQKFEREQAQGAGSDASDGEKTAAFLAGRVAGGIQDINTALKDHPDAAKPSVIASMAGALPMVGDVARNALNSSSRQQIEAAQMDVLDAALTLGTGAAYSKEQLAGYQQAYFPQIGDTPETVQGKRVRLERLLSTARVKAGAASPMIDQALSSVPALFGEQVPDQTGGGQVQFKDEQPDLQTPRLSSDQQAAYNAFLNHNPNATAEQLQAFVSSIGGGSLDNAQAIIDARKAGAGFVGAEDAVYNEDAYRQQLDQQLQQQGGDSGVEHAFGRGATAGLSDEIYGIGRAAEALAAGENVPAAYTNARDLERRATERAYEGNPVGSFVSELGGGLLIPGGGASDLKGLARIGAIQGGTAGFGYGNGAAGSIGGGLIGAPVGAAVGAGTGALLPKLSSLVKSPRATEEVLNARPLIEAGERQRIPIRQPDARPSVRGDFAGVEASQTGHPIVTQAREADKAAVQNRLSEVGGQGQVLDDYDLGQRVQSGGEKYLAKTRAQANALYTRAEQAAGNAQGEATGALQAIDQQIADLKSTGENTNSGAIKYLTDLKADLQGGASIAKLRNIRSNVRGQINERNLTQTDTERRVGMVLDSLSQDVERILPQQARGAFKNADKFYRDRQQFKDQVVRRFVGAKNDPISPETAAARFNSFMRSKDYGRFSRMMDQLEPGDKADIAATVAEHLGTARNGEFSLGALATNVEKFSPRALEKVFGKDGAAAITDLKAIARAKSDTAGSLNSSKTGIVNQRMGIKDAMMGIMGGSVAGIPGAIGGMALRNVGEKIGNRRLANALLNPDFTKWLKNAPNNPAAARPYIRTLSAVAARNAGAAGDIKAIQSALTEAFAQSPGRAAAQGEQENNGR